MEERLKFVYECEKGEQPMAELCRQYGVSRKTGYKWLARYEEGGVEAVADRSRAPLEHANQVSNEVAEAVLGERVKHPRWGPKKLRVVLERREPQQRWPAESTIAEMLKRAGLTAWRKQRQRVPEYKSTVAESEGPNQVWCIDYKGQFYCGDGQRCDPLTLSDDYSRYLLRCQQVRSLEESYARALLETAFREYGIPEAIRSDNGTPFASVALAGLSELSVWLIKLGIRPERIERGKPQQNGRHERMHRTLKEATANPPQANLRAQQKSFDAFRREYNEQRPHEALGMNTPAQVYRRSAREYPQRLPKPEYPSGAIVRTVGSCGRIRWNGERIFITKTLSNEAIRLESVEDGVWRLWFGFYPFALLDDATLRVSELPKASRSRGASATAISAQNTPSACTSSIPCT